MISHGVSVLGSARRLRRVLLAGLTTLALLPAVSAASAAPLRAVATTSMVADLVRQVGGDRVTVEGLMGPGVDPHLYKASASDVIRLQRAQVIFYNGLALEGKMGDLLTRLARAQRHVYAVTEGVPEDRLLQPEDFEGHHDPHVWFDVTLWAKCAEAVVAALIAVDPSGAEHYRARGAEVQARFAALHAWALARVAELPAERRVLVTSHDAYNYFGRAYGFEVVGLQGISTVSEAGLADLTRLADFIRARGVKAVFVESSVSPATLERLASDAGVRIGGELFSDAMGTPGKKVDGYDLGTYEGMVRHNVNTIVAALR